MRQGFSSSSGRLIGVLAATALALLLWTPIAQTTTEAEQIFLNLSFTPDTLRVVSTTRSLKSIDRIAENVQVISAADIARIGVVKERSTSLGDKCDTFSG